MYHHLRYGSQTYGMSCGLCIRDGRGGPYIPGRAKETAQSGRVSSQAHISAFPPFGRYLKVGKSSRYRATPLRESHERLMELDEMTREH